MSVMQDLYDSDINVHLASRRNGGWRVRIGDADGETALETYAESWQEVERWVTDQAVARFPNSEFAAKYRPRGWHRRPYLTLVQ